MGYSIEIDIGGTYINVVIYHSERHCVFSSAKALTTRENLSMGILNTLDARFRDASGHVIVRFKEDIRTIHTGYGSELFLGAEITATAIAAFSF